MSTNRNPAARRVERLEYLAGMLSKYAHRWNAESNSARLNGWVDEYEDIRNDYPAVFAYYCERTNRSPEHTAYDCLA